MQLNIRHCNDVCCHWSVLSVLFFLLFLVEDQKYSHISVDWITVFGNKHFWHLDVMCISWLCWIVNDSHCRTDHSVLWDVSLAQLVQFFRDQRSAVRADIISYVDEFFSIHSMLSCLLKTIYTFSLFVRVSYAGINGLCLVDISCTKWIHLKLSKLCKVCACTWVCDCPLSNVSVCVWVFMGDVWCSLM